MSTLRYERKYAKRNHKRRCNLTNSLIEPGDLFVVSCWVDGSDFYARKYLAIIEDIVHNIWPETEYEGWPDYETEEALYSWLLSHLEDDEAHLCYKAAMSVWNENYKAAMSVWKENLTQR